MPRIHLTAEDVRQLPLTYEATIPDDYLDEMGHMNVMWYTHLFSQAMGGMFQLLGMDWDRLAEMDAGTFALEAHIRYLSEVRVGHDVQVHSRMIGRSEKRFHAIHFMINLNKQDVASTFESVGAYIDLNERRMAAFPQQIAGKIDCLVQEHAELNWAAPLSGIMNP
jgi:acyl-CoA thioester hydrolase